MASTILALPACTATVEIVVVEGCSDESSESSDETSSEVVRLSWSMVDVVLVVVACCYRGVVVAAVSSDVIKCVASSKLVSSPLPSQAC